MQSRDSKAYNRHTKHTKQHMRPFFFFGYHIFGSKKVLFEEAPEKCFLLKHFSQIIIIIIIKRQVYSRAYSTEA